MQDNFNLAKYLRHGNKLLNENIGGYFDLKPLKEMDFNEMDSTEDGVFSITLDTATDLNKIKMYAKSKGISVNVVNPEGPAGGWPEVEYTGSKEALEGFIDKFFPQDADDTKSEIMPVDGNMNELNDLGMTEEDKQDDMSLEELMGNAMEIEELEKPEKIYADDEQDDSANMSTYDYMASQYELQLQKIVTEIINDGFEPEDAAQFLRDYADHLDKGGF